MYLVTLSVAMWSCNSQNASQDLLPRSALFLLSPKALSVVFSSAYTEPIKTLHAMGGAQMMCLDLETLHRVTFAQSLVGSVRSAPLYLITATLF